MPASDASIATAWLQHRLTIGGRVTTTLGVRSDTHSEFGTAVSPKIAANARLDGGVSVRASYGRGFRAPDIGQLYYRFLNPSSIYQVIGNPIAATRVCELTAGRRRVRHARAAAPGSASTCSATTSAT